MGMAGSTLGPWLIGQIGQRAGLAAPLAGMAVITLLIAPILVAVYRSDDARAARAARAAGGTPSGS
jgi:hypothetical protein